MRALLLLVGLFAAIPSFAPSASGAPGAQPAEVVERVVLEHFTGAGMLRLLTNGIDILEVQMIEYDYDGYLYRFQQQNIASGEAGEGRATYPRRGSGRA